MRIFVDLPVDGAAKTLLLEGTEGHELVFPTRPAASVLHAAEPDSALATADIAFGQPDRGLIESSSTLRWIQISSSGFTRYDHPEFRRFVASHGIQVSNSAAVFANGCATHVLSFLLAQARQLPVALASQAPNGSPEWTVLRQASRTLEGETALILGYGAIGRRLVELLTPLGIKLLAYRRKARGDEGIPVVEDIGEALAGADHVINILPDNPESVGFFNAARLARIKEGAIFYNIGRGTTVDQSALAAALHAGKLGAAWLDVTDPEPLPADHELRSAPRCYITPHTAGGSGDEMSLLVRHFLSNLRAFEAGQPLAGRIM
jgi:phosphoglycerate dehydrogenase-like enzyme